MWEGERLNRPTFFQRFAIPETEHAAVEACLSRGVTAYAQQVLGHSPREDWPNPFDYLNQPIVFGFAALEIVRDSTLAIATQQTIVHHTLGLIDPTERGGVPYGLPVFLSFLAKTGSLSAATFRSILLVAESNSQNPFDLWTEDELVALFDWLVTQSTLAEEEQVWWIQHLSCYAQSLPLGQRLQTELLDHPALTAGFKRKLCLAWLADSPQGQPPMERQVLQARLHGETVMEAIFMGRSPLESFIVREQDPSVGWITDSNPDAAPLLRGQLPFPMPDYLKAAAAQALHQFAFTSEEPG